MKGKEGLVRKRVGDNLNNKWFNRLSGNLQYLLLCFCRKRWRKLWCIIQESFILGISPKTGEIRMVLLFDNDFAFSSGYKQTGLKNGIHVSNLSRTFIMKASELHTVKEWTDCLEKVALTGPGKEFIQPCPFKSFAPSREDQRAYWFVDGESYMSAVADVIDKAREEIFITDWWLSPEIYLKRGAQFSDKYRLDNLLRRKAAEGVKIFVLLYKELQLALALDSLYSKKALMSRGGRNLKVLRHPDRVGTDVNQFLWAHHEKIVVVDQSYAFVGGIDLCYGRWDNGHHRLTDLPPDAESVVDGNGNPSSNLNPWQNRPVNSSRALSTKTAEGAIMHALKSTHQVSVGTVRALGDPERDGNAKVSDDPDRGNIIKLKFRRAVSLAKNKLKREESLESSDLESDFGEDCER